MPSHKLQIQWIREEIETAERYAEQDRLLGGDGRFQDGKAAGLRAGLKLIGVEK